MKGIKFFSIIVCIIMIFNILTPIFSLATNELTNENKTNIQTTENNNSEEEIIDKQGIVDNQTMEKTEETDYEKNQNIEKLNNVKDRSKTKNIDIEDDNTGVVNIEEDIEQENNAETEDFSVYITNNGNRINSYNKDENTYIFVPKGIELSELKINYTGHIESIDGAYFDESTKQITGNFHNESNFIVNLTDGQTKNIIIMQSNIPCIYVNNIKSKEEDGVIENKTLEDINSNSKEIKYDASVFITDGENEENDISQTIEIKGRGNYTWSLPKKGYQIKFNKKQSVLGMKKAKTWILLANYTDNSYERNKIALDFARNIGLNYTPNYKFVDFWADGNYIGNYMLIEKIQINENRVNLNNEYGLISELDNSYYIEEDIWFKSDLSQTAFTLKDSCADDLNNEESIAKQAFNNFRNDINNFEETLYNDKNWEQISSIIDVESFIKYYFVQELSENPDGCRSSIFMYKDGNDDKVHMGPVWDYDIAFGNFEVTNWGR